jgi:hypothetical protein
VRLLADENIPLASIRVLRAGGHDVLAASETMAGALDREVLARAGAEGRALNSWAGTPWTQDSSRRSSRR